MYEMEISNHLPFFLNFLSIIVNYKTADFLKYCYDHIAVRFSLSFRKQKANSNIDSVPIYSKMK